MVAELLGPAMVMTGGGMLTASSFALARVTRRLPLGAIGVALDEAFSPDASPVSDELASLVDRIP